MNLLIKLIFIEQEIIQNFFSPLISIETIDLSGFHSLLAEFRFFGVIRNIRGKSEQKKFINFALFNSKNYLFPFTPF